METSKEAFPKALQKLLDEHDISQRELVRRTKRQSNWGAPMTIHYLMHGELRPTIEAMENIARAFQVPPERFAEYRLAKARQQLDPEVVGLRKALKNLDAS